jgi:hypothetical protein
MTKRGTSKTGGKEENGVVWLMRKYHIPITRGNYIHMAYFGKASGGMGTEERGRPSTGRSRMA